MVLLLMEVAVAEMLRRDLLVSQGRCLVIMMIRPRLIVYRGWSGMSQIDSFLVLAMWHVIMFLNQGVGP